MPFVEFTVSRNIISSPILNLTTSRRGRLTSHPSQ